MNNTSKSRDVLIEEFICTRAHTNKICAPLATEDYLIQPCPEVSPPKWHLAHTTWFFEEFILKKFSPKYKPVNSQYSPLFNSYYKSVGEHWLQGQRGTLSRPTVEEVFTYRKLVEEQIISFLKNSDPNSQIDFLLEAGIHHEQQHQELLLMDIKYILATNPIPVTYSALPLPPSTSKQVDWVSFNEGIYEIGHSNTDFAYDNESPQHKFYLYPFALRTSTVTNGEYLEFIQDKGYTRPDLWLSEGWDWINKSCTTHPLYWKKENDSWFEFTLHGIVPLDLNRPVSHISYFEADAFANWAKHRLPTEQELETYLRHTNHNTNEVWCWTRSQYSSYPRSKTFDGVLSEYNGKFMCNQFVLRGGCVATPKGHYRHSYRNFYQPQQRWMFSGIRLAKDI